MTNHGEMLSPLDPDLPLLASQAAIEVDRVIRQQPIGFTAVKKLASLLSNSVEVGPDPGSTFALIDPTTAALVTRAFRVSKVGADVRTVDELAHKAWDIAQSLNKSDESSDAESLLTIRAFCVALSECAASYVQSVYAERPSHPHRR